MAHPEFLECMRNQKRREKPEKDGEARLTSCVTLEEIKPTRRNEEVRDIDAKAV
jgi:hypothetical protein